MSDTTNAPAHLQEHRDSQQGFWRRSPLFLAVLALLMMVGGWKLSSYRPYGAAREHQQLEILRAQAREFDRTHPSQRSLANKITQYTQRQLALHAWIGRVILYAGVVLFLVALIGMYYHIPEPELEEEVPQADSDPDADLQGD